MGHITISLKKEDEMKLRRLAHERYNSRKGGMSQVIADALDSLGKESIRERAVKSAIERMEKGFHMGKWLFKHRSELYDR